MKLLMGQSRNMRGHARGKIPGNIPGKVPPRTLILQNKVKQGSYEVCCYRVIIPTVCELLMHAFRDDGSACVYKEEV